MGRGRRRADGPVSSKVVPQGRLAWLAAAMAFCFLLAQAVSLHDLATAFHVRCPLHGELIHLGTAPEARPDGSRLPSTGRGEAFDFRCLRDIHCLAASAISQRLHRESSGHFTDTSALTENWAAFAPGTREAAPPPIVLYLLAPKQSPPPSC